MTDPDSWALVDFGCPAETSEILAAELWARGVAAIEELGPHAGGVILRTSLGSDAGEQIDEILALFPGVTVTPVAVPRSVADTWRKFVTPSHVVDDVWIVPEWCERPSGRSVVVEPFDTFGLGNHPTTVLTMRAALTCVRPGSVVMDLGSGSGVLAVGVASLVGCRVDAHDIAAQSRHALAHNARLNGVEDLVHWRDELTEADAGTYDVVLANILAPVLRQLSGDMERAVRSGGSMILRGLRSEQVDSVTGCFVQCAVVAAEQLDGWASVTLVRD